MKHIVLASSSPRRKEILSRYIENIEIIASDIEENISEGEGPLAVAMALAFEKAHDVACKIDKGKIIIAADTIVYCNNILGKPKNEKDAINMLLELSGKEHYVITGVCILESGKDVKIVDYVKTKVKFRTLSVEKIKRYIATQEYKDKAGSYGIQGYGAVLVESIEGSYSNVVGLPIHKIDSLLEKHFGFSLL